MSEEEKKIIIDEDWKSQVEAEREAAKHGESSGAEAASGASEESAVPPASMTTLITTLTTQAMVALGMVPDPTEEQPVVRLDLAKHFIDTLSVLEEKTKGNLTAAEAQLLDGTLHQLRMAYVASGKER